MRNEFTGVVEKDGEWFVAYCPEIPGANGQGKTKDEAIALILEDRRKDGLRGVPADAVRETVTVQCNAGTYCATSDSTAAISSGKAPATRLGESCHRAGRDRTQTC
jgi:hypothetical protein